LESFLYCCLFHAELVALGGLRALLYGFGVPFVALLFVGVDTVDAAVLE
jgi:hypothetical protein